MAVATLGAFVVVTGVLGLVSLYLGAVTQALSEVPRSSPLPDYPGRPDPSATPDVATPMRYLVLVTDSDGGLTSAYLAQLSGRRDTLQLVGLPANLLTSDVRDSETTLAETFAAGGPDAVRAVEAMLGLRIDHLVEVELAGFTRVIDVVGGVKVPNRAEMSAEGWHFPAGELRLSSADAAVYLSANKQPMIRLERTEAVFVEILRGIVGGDALTNPAKVDTVGEVLRNCLTVDAGLTPGEIRRTALDVHLSAETIDGTSLPLAGLTEVDGETVILADAERVADLARALASDDASAWAKRQADPWKPLVTLPPR